MRRLARIGFMTVLLLAATIIAAQASSSVTKINFSSLDASRPYKLSGTLYLPGKCPGPCPAVVEVHGAMGIDSRAAFYREPLLGAGIAVFEVNFKTGVYASGLFLPPLESFLPMAFAALKELRKTPGIDPARIAIMGFSLGGGIALRTAVESNVKQWMGDEKGFAAQVAFYPVCQFFIPTLESGLSALTGTPMIILYGTRDCYGDGKAVPELKKLLAKKYNFDVTTVRYPGAAHGFNRDEPPVSFRDPRADHRTGHMEWNAEAANDSVSKVVNFLGENLGVR